MMSGPWVPPCPPGHGHGSRWCPRRPPCGLWSVVCLWFSQLFNSLNSPILSTLQLESCLRGGEPRRPPCGVECGFWRCWGAPGLTSKSTLGDD